MFTGLEVFSPQLSVPLLYPVGWGTIDDDYIQLRDILGLEPVKATVNTTPYATLDGEHHSGSHVGKRNIIVKFGLNPNYADQTVDGLRNLLYRYFMPKMQVTLRISSTHAPTVDISGIVEDIVPNIFSKDPEVQVSVICPNPDFIAVATTTITGEVGDGIPMLTINNPGNVETGFILKVTAVPEVPSYVGPLRIITQSLLPEVFSATVDISNDFAYEMSSIRGRKYARNVEVDTGNTTNRFQALDLTSQWPQLYPGENQFAVICQLGSEGQEWELKYNARFWGL